MNQADLDLMRRRLLAKDAFVQRLQHPGEELQPLSAGGWAAQTSAVAFSGNYYMSEWRLVFIGDVNRDGKVDEMWMLLFDRRHIRKVRRTPFHTNRVIETEEGSIVLPRDRAKILVAQWKRQQPAPEAPTVETVKDHEGDHVCGACGALHTVAGRCWMCGRRLLDSGEWP